MVMFTWEWYYTVWKPHGTWQPTRCTGFCVSNLIIIMFLLLVKAVLLITCFVTPEQLCRCQSWAENWIPPLGWKEDLDVRLGNRREPKLSCPSFWLMVNHTYFEWLFHSFIHSFMIEIYNDYICIYSNSYNNGYLLFTDEGPKKLSSRGRKR